MSKVAACLMAGWVQGPTRAEGPISAAIVIGPPGLVPLTVGMAQAAMPGTGRDLYVTGRDLYVPARRLR